MFKVTNNGEYIFFEKRSKKQNKRQVFTINGEDVLAKDIKSALRQWRQRQ